MKQQGLTLIEVIIAITIMTIVFVALIPALSGSLKHSTLAGQRTQAGQILNYLGRRVAGGDSVILPAAGDTNTWAYHALTSAFPEMSSEKSFADPDSYRASIESVGAVVMAGTSVVQYNLEVCFMRDGAEHCVAGTTLGPAPVAGSKSPIIPGIN